MKKYDVEFCDFGPTSAAQDGAVINSQPYSNTQPLTDGTQPFPDTIPDTTERIPDTVQHNSDDVMEMSLVSMPQNTNSVPSEPPPSYNEAVTLQPSRLDMSETII